MEGELLTYLRISWKHSEFFWNSVVHWVWVPLVCGIYYVTLVSRLHYTTPLTTYSSSSLQYGVRSIWSLAWSLLLPFHREPENLGSILILEGPADSCCTTWAESRLLSFGLWKTLQSPNCTSDVERCFHSALTQHKLTQDHFKSPFMESPPLPLPSLHDEALIAWSLLCQMKIVSACNIA